MPMVEDSLLDEIPAQPERLWTPWRMAYVGSGTRESGCIFCNRLAAANDTASLILWRAAHSFAIMNLFPYNTGHIMLVPNAHVADPEDAEPETLTEMALVRQPLLRALRRALSPDGFNLGINVGSVAGAGVAGHLHEHIVPRWAGDANFMPILAATMVLPELIPVTYAKLRAEIGREMGTISSLDLVMLHPFRDQVLIQPDGRLPGVEASTGQAIWRQAADRVSTITGQPANLLGWVGNENVEAGSVTLAYQLTTSVTGAWTTIDHLSREQRAAAERALSIVSFAPSAPVDD